MSHVKSVHDHLTEMGLSLDELVARSRLDHKIVRAIVECRWTASRTQRERIAEALGLSIGSIAWGLRPTVEHLYGHGPQFGRSP